MEESKNLDIDIGQFLNGGPEAKWYRVPGYPKAEVQICNIKPSRRRDILKSCTRQRMRRGVLVTETDDDRLGRLLLEECVVGWKGIEHGGNDFPCNKENKILLDDHWAEFNTLWNAVLGNLTGLDEAMAEAELGNLPTGQTST